MVIDCFGQLHEKGLIGDQDLVDQLAGELVGVDGVLHRGKDATAGNVSPRRSSRGE